MSWGELIVGVFRALFGRKEAKKSQEEWELELARAIDKRETWRKEALLSWEKIAKLRHRVEQLEAKLQKAGVAIPTEDDVPSPLPMMTSQAIVPTLWSEDIHRMQKEFARQMQNVATEKGPPDEPTL